jgi:protein involved in polysaccharide export with SLBB domain
MKRCIVLMILLSLLAPAAMAATVTISPTKINPGDTVTVDVKDIPDNAKFSLSINAEFNANPGDELNFELATSLFPSHSTGRA